MITTVKFDSTSATEQQNVPVTFGHVFAAGDLPQGEALAGLLDDGTTISLQVDAKATHADGSVRHAVISALLPSLGVGQSRTMQIVKAGPQAVSEPTSARVLHDNEFGASAHATFDGIRYYVSADYLVFAEANPYAWLSGPIVTEWHVSAPLATADGVAHPHLCARFAIRYYHAIKQARVDVTIENAWAYEPAPQNFTYDAEIVINGQVVYSQPALVHFHHARWRKVFWTGEAPQVHVKHDSAYLIASRALPNYDQSIMVRETTLAGYVKKWTPDAVGPMKIGPLVNGYMPATGGRRDIGLLPGWAAAYLISQDERAKYVTLGTADMAGSWSMHYRDRDTDQPISLIDYPYMTILGTAGDTRNPNRIDPETNRGTLETFPAFSKKENPTPYTVDTAHQPSFAYLPYLVTGDHYYLEELQFWAMWNMFASNPGYRKKDAVWRGQVRAIAWGLRSLGEAAYITPDGDRLKEHLLAILRQNMEVGNAQYAHNPDVNPLGVFTGAGAVVYGGKTSVAPWQDDYLTAALGSLVEKGFEEARPMFEWKARFPVERMAGEGANWLAAATYSLPVKRTDGTDITEVADVYREMEAKLAESTVKTDVDNLARMRGGGVDMAGYATSTEGFVANMQPALAYAAPLSEKGRAAWAQLQKRSPKPDYGISPQFAIVPRVAVDVIEVEPIPEPEPTPVEPPKPDPVPMPEPEPMPAPIDPVPEPLPEPDPTPDPEPAPQPDPVTIPEPQPEPQPVPAPRTGTITGLTMTVFDPATLEVAQGDVSLSGIEVVQGADLEEGKHYAASLADSTGKVIKVMFPLMGLKR